jgi:hypothetical protein
MELYCNNLYQRLVKEEELLQIAQRVISLEEWFAIAASFLSHDAAKYERKRYGRSSGPRLLPAPASTACL